MIAILITIFVAYITISVFLPMVVDHIKFFGKFVVCYILTHFIIQKFSSFNVSSFRTVIQNFVIDRLNDTVTKYM